uniref:Bromodomain adjacent to zinc finger domain, 2A n=1 Tax=Tetraodon nigroviridis TaxID=99883 RepID=H3D4X9_TETNG
MQMDSNNRFNYGSNSSANSGLKRSSGDSLYTNGSSMSFPPQGKNLNGEMNVNGATTVHGSGVPGPHPPAAPYPHVSNHHQSGAGYDYLWGGPPQYAPSMGSSAGHGMHQKQPAPGMAPPSSQHHFQGHGQYQLNGGVDNSHQSSVAGPPNMPHPGSQYWNRNNPSTQQMSYNSHSMFGSYQSPPHPMLPNGMPYYQHQPQHTSLPPPQHQQQQTQPAQPQGQHSEQPAAQFPETAPSPRESVTSTPPRSTCHAPMSPCLSMDATPPRVPAIPALSLCPASSPGTPTAQCQDVGTSSPPLSLSEAPSRLSSSPVGVQGFRSQTQLMTTQHDKPVVPSVSFASSAGLKSLSAGADPALMPIPSASSVGSRPPEPMSTHPPHTYHLSSAASSAASLGAPQSSNTEPSSPNPALSQASRLSSPEQEPRRAPQASGDLRLSTGPNIQPTVKVSVTPRRSTVTHRSPPPPEQMFKIPQRPQAVSPGLTHSCPLSQKVTPPSFSMKDQNFIAFSTAAEGPAVHPLQPITDQVVPAAEEVPKSKTRKPTGESKGRRVATEEQVQFPLQHGWKREIRVKKLENRMKAETWYYTPCGRRMKQFPEIIKYLKKHTDSLVSREHFSFSPRMPVGDFYEERESPEGAAWVLLANEEVPSMIMTITGRRGRPPNPDKEKLCRVRGLKGGRRPGRPPKTNVVDLLSKVDAKLLKRLEAKEALTEEEKEKLAKIKKKMKRKVSFFIRYARTKRMENAKMKKLREEKKKAKQTDEERLAQGKRVPGARSKAKALAKAQAEAEAAAQAAVAAKRAAERRAQAQKRLEERKRQQLITEELKKPTEDMCLTDHKPLPELSRIPGVVLSGAAFSHCLAVVEFLHAYGKLIGLDVPKDIPSLATLQEGLLGLGESQGKLQDLLMKLVETALHDPGLPSYYQSVKILGDKLVELQLTRSSVSEVLRIFLESHGYDTDVCNTMRTKTFHSLPPDAKAAILGFLVDELNGSNIVTNDIDNTLENMTTWRKNKWIIEGKLRKLKSALARRTGRSAEDMCFEERRRSARVAEEENLSLEESGLVLERGSRRARKEEPKLSDTESPSNASIPELERQIDKLTKRQAFFRKKLLQSSQTMRATLLGQDRYRRRYLMLPHLGGVLVEGPEELLTEVPVTFLKKEPKVEENPVPTTPHPTALPHAQPQASSPDEDPLPDTTSLMCRPRGRGRPRKIKPEVELHLRTAKIRRRRRNSVKSGGEEGPGSPSSATQELSQNAFQSWLSHSQDALVNGTSSAAGSDPEESVKDMAEKQGQWFNLLPKQPCDDAPLALPDAPPAPDCSPLAPPHLLPASTPLPKPAPATPSRPARRRRRGSRGSSPARRGARAAAAAKRRGRPPNSVFQELEQQYFTQLVVKPIPASMVRGWWWIKDPEELYSILQALHPRGVRERVLHKHLAKHMENLAEVCTQPISDHLFDLKVEDKDALLEELQKPWQVQEKTMETDISVLKWVEDLEQRVVSADLHLKPYTIPDPDSTRDDLQYYEHDANPHDDWIIRTKKEWSGLPRIATHPLDLAVLRLANLERNIERRYLKEPLWNPAEVMRLAPLTPTPGEEHPMDVISLESEITSRLRTWRQALDRCRSAPQVCLCLLQLEKAIAWERSVTRVTCQVCRKGDNDDCLLLCDGCDRGCHMYCLKPKITQVPEGDWFCPTCVDQQTESPLLRSCKKRTRMKKKRPYEDDSSEDEILPRRSGGMATRHKEAPAASTSRSSAESAAKRRRMTTRNQPDLTFCEIILMEMEAHADAWPFLEPVNPRLVPGYRRIIKNPMDFTMRERLLQGEYNSCEEFAADAQLVFNNCELFNEDTSEVGVAGHAMRRFFESRWAEFYSNKDK